jgi:hypothetical protein
MFCEFLGLIVPLLDQFDISLRRLDAPLRFLLKSVQDVYLLSKLHRHDSAIGSLVIPHGNFQNTTAHTPLNGLVSLGIPPNWSNCNSSPISFRAPSGNSRRLFFASPSQTTERRIGTSKRFTPNPFI